MPAVTEKQVEAVARIVRIARIATWGRFESPVQSGTVRGAGGESLPRRVHATEARLRSFPAPGRRCGGLGGARGRRGSWAPGMRAGSPRTQVGSLRSPMGPGACAPMGARTVPVAGPAGKDHR